MIQNSANRKGHEATCPVHFWVYIRNCSVRGGWGGDGGSCPLGCERVSSNRTKASKEFPARGTRLMELYGHIKIPLRTF
eukprot:410844-Prorocentrum_minimum.AAC.1